MANSRCLLCRGTGKKVRCHRVRYKEMAATEGCNGYNAWGCEPNPCNCPTVTCNCGGGCFVTTAALIAAGKHDDCNELETFRKFRDEYLLQNYKDDVDLYYNISPEILRGIQTNEKQTEILTELWKNELSQTLILIQSNELELAYDLYKKTMKKLYEKYIF